MGYLLATLEFYKATSWKTNDLTLCVSVSVSVYLVQSCDPEQDSKQTWLVSVDWRGRSFFFKFQAMVIDLRLRIKHNFPIALN